MTAAELDSILADVRVAANSHRRCWRDEAFSVGYLAAAEGIATHNATCGSLRSRCAYLVRRRIVDYIRSEYGRSMYGPRRRVPFPPVLPNIERLVLVAEVLRIAERLSPRQKQVVDGYLADDSVIQIADRMHIAPDTVSATYSQAVSRLRGWMIPEGQRKN